MAEISSVTPSLTQSPARSFRLRSTSLNAVRLRRVFDLFDRNGDGEITVSELALALNRLGLGANTAELQSTVAPFFQPGRDGLAYEDFESFHRALGEKLFGEEVTSDEELGGGDEEEEEVDMREAFNVFDEDGDGFISAGELQAVLEKLELPEGRSLELVRQMICSVDRDNDGRVDFGEFKHMMRSIEVRA